MLRGDLRDDSTDTGRFYRCVGCILVGLLRQGADRDAGDLFRFAPDSGYSVCDIFPPDPEEDSDPQPVEPEDYLGRNYPNPFNPVTEISFGLKEQGHVLIRIYDAGGRLVRTLVDADMFVRRSCRDMERY